MEFSVHLVPTKYEQPRPIDGTYPATVYRTYAEFEYEGFKVLADAPNTRMNADGNSGAVTVEGDRAYVTWEGSANVSSTSEAGSQAESIYSEQGVFEATLLPSEFGQPHPFNLAAVYGGEVSSRTVQFGEQRSYEAALDGDLVAGALGAPCKVFQRPEDPLKCVVEIDDDIVFLMKRYGKGSYEKLVKNAVRELRSLTSKD